MSTIKVLKKPIYQTTDGQTFEDSKEAVAHQVSIDQTDQVAAFVATLGFSERATKQAAKVIMGWEIYKVQGEHGGNNGNAAP